MRTETLGTNPAPIVTPAFATIRKSGKRPKKVASLKTIEKHPDHKLIEHCIDVVSNLQAASGSFKADPTGNNDFAAAWDNIFCARARKALRQATEAKAQTFDGIRSKAVVMDAILENLLNCSPADPEEVAFLQALSADIVRLQRAFQDKHRSSDRKFSELNSNVGT